MWYLYRPMANCSVLLPDNTADNCTLEDGEVLLHSETRQVGCDICGCKDGRLRCTHQKDCEVSKNIFTPMVIHVSLSLSFIHKPCRTKKTIQQCPIPVTCVGMSPPVQSVGLMVGTTSPGVLQSTVLAFQLLSSKMGHVRVK